MSESDSLQPKFAIQRVYVKDISFESPGAPETFRIQGKPSVNLDLNTKNQSLEDGLWEVVLTLTITAKAEDERTLYLAEVQQAGIFEIAGLEGEMTEQTLASLCPSILFPYARENIDSLITKGTFPPLMLAPVNFDALYEQAKLARERQDASVQ